MTANFTGGAGGGSYTYAGDSQPSEPVEGETWYDTGDNEAYVYDGTGWVKQTVTDHGEIGGVSEGQHFDAGNALAFASGALDVQEGGIDYGNLAGTPSETQSGGKKTVTSDFTRYYSTTYLDDVTINSHVETVVLESDSSSLDFTIEAANGHISRSGGTSYSITVDDWVRQISFTNSGDRTMVTFDVTFEQTGEHPHEM